MNGPAWIFLGVLLVAGTVMAVGARRLRGVPARSKADRFGRPLYAVIWLAAVIGVIAFAHPGSQPALTGLVVAGILAALHLGLKGLNAK